MTRTRGMAPRRSSRRAGCASPDRPPLPPTLSHPDMNLVIVRTTLLLIASNVFMTFAWYAHLRNLSGRLWYVAALVSWGIALFEYLLQVPANRVGAVYFMFRGHRVV